MEIGIDIGDIDAVVLFGASPLVEALLQRIGRECHRAQKTNVIYISRDRLGSFRETAVFQRFGLWRRAGGCRRRRSFRKNRSSGRGLEQQAVLSGKFAKSGAKRLSSVKQTNHFSAATSAGVSGAGVDGIAVEEPGSGKGAWLLEGRADGCRAGGVVHAFAGVLSLPSESWQVLFS